MDNQNHTAAESASPFINTTCLVTDIAPHVNGGDLPHTQFSLQCLAMDAFNNTFPLEIEFFVSDPDKARTIEQSIQTGTFLNVCGQFLIIDGTMALYDPKYEVLSGEQYDLHFHFADSPHGPMIDIGKTIFHAVNAVTEMMALNSTLADEMSGLKTILDASNGRISVGVGNASGELRAVNAAESAIARLFPRIMSGKSVSSVVISICGSPDMTIDEYAVAANLIQEKISDEANVSIGTHIKPDWRDRMEITVLFTVVTNNDTFI